MKVIIIPDSHLKPWIFDKANELLENGLAEKAVCLMDIADDWGEEANLDLYEKTYNRAITFAKEHPETLWCYGNHDLSYIWDELESGYSYMASWTVKKKIKELKEALADPSRLAYIHRIDNVLFSHGGLAYEFVRNYIPGRFHDDIDHVIWTINNFGRMEMWQDLSPIWYRPQEYKGKMFKAKEHLQVVGHTPVEKIQKDRNVISCDVFSTYRDGTPIGAPQFLVIDTKTGECTIIPVE